MKERGLSRDPMRTHQIPKDPQFVFQNPLCFLAWSEVSEYFSKAKDV
jgi:hypothetical protein